MERLMVLKHNIKTRRFRGLVMQQCVRCQSAWSAELFAQQPELADERCPGRARKTRRKR